MLTTRAHPDMRRHCEDDAAPSCGCVGEEQRCLLFIFLQGINVYVNITQLNAGTLSLNNICVDLMRRCCKIQQLEMKEYMIHLFV